MMLKERIAKYRLVASSFGASLILTAGGALWAYFRLAHNDQPLIIHFNNLVRINQIGSVNDLLGFGVFGVLMVIINFFLAMDLEERDWFLGKFIAAATLGLAVLIFITFAAIISVN